ncbi:MAG: DMT family transporter [Dehalococcoidia bacterium]|nr:DMT family transporter [Dehalococcoidia bacterium]
MSGTAPESHSRGMGAIVIAAVLLSTGGLFIKAVDLDAYGISMWRSLLAAVTIWAILRPSIWKRPSATVLAIAVSYAGMLLFLVIATRLTTAANAIFLQFTAPLYVAVLAGLFLRERPTRLDLTTLAITFAGMSLFFVGKLETDALAGNLFGLAAGVCFGCMLVLFRAQGVSAEDRVAAVIIGNVGLAAMLLPVNIVRDEGDVFTPGLADAAGLAFMGFVQIGLGYIAMAYGIARVAALEASLINMVEPVLNPVWVFIFLGENPGGWAVLGGGIIVAAVTSRILLGERGRRPGAAVAVR